MLIRKRRKDNGKFLLPDNEQQFLDEECDFPNKLNLKKHMNVRTTLKCWLKCSMDWAKTFDAVLAWVSLTLQCLKSMRKSYAEPQQLGAFYYSRQYGSYTLYLYVNCVLICMMHFMYVVLCIHYSFIYLFIIFTWLIDYLNKDLKQWNIYEPPVNSIIA